MSKYHVNPSTGEVSRCFALLGPCPFGGRLDHYDTAAAAGRAFEKAMSGKTWTALYKTVSGRRASGEDEKAKIDEILSRFPVSDHAKSLAAGESFKSGRKDHFRTMYSDLPLGQRLALDVYTLEDHARTINLSLLEDPTGTNLLKTDYADMVRNLDSFLSGARVSVAEFSYRGVPLVSKLERQVVLEELASLSIGDRLVFDGYTSTSTSLINAMDFAESEGSLVCKEQRAQGPLPCLTQTCGHPGALRRPALTPWPERGSGP